MVDLVGVDPFGDIIPDHMAPIRALDTIKHQGQLLAFTQGGPLQ